MARRTAEDSEATRDALVTAARRLFSERGYAAVGTGEIVAAAGVTRGALYHHFSDKQELFAAAFRAIELEVVGRIAARMAEATDPVAALLLAVDVMLTTAAEDESVRLAFTEAPVVLGDAGWRAVVEDTSLGLTRATLAHAMETGVLRPVPLEPLAHLLLASLSEAARMVVSGADPGDVRATLALIIEGLRA